MISLAISTLQFIYPSIAKDHELGQAVKDYDSRLMQATQSLAEYKHRALNAEVRA